MFRFVCVSVYVYVHDSDPRLLCLFLPSLFLVHYPMGIFPLLDLCLYVLWPLSLELTLWAVVLARDEKIRP